MANPGRQAALEGVMRLKGLAAMLEVAQAAKDCAATREAVEELEYFGDSGCLLCGGRAAFHKSEKGKGAA